jgi:hypothetical protein
MTRQHFEAIARILKDANDVVPDGTMDDYDQGHQQAVETIINDMATYLDSQNPNFDQARFLRACGVAGGES